MTDWKEGWEELVNQTHTDQGIWFLNGFWDDVEDDAESIWDMVHLMIELECGKKKLYGSKKWEEKEGNDLDQFQAHQFLEKMGSTLTVKELRNILKKIDIDNNNRMCITEYLVHKYGQTGQSVVGSPQGGGDPEEFEAAKKQFNEASDKLREAITAQEKMNEAVLALEAEEKKYNDKLKKWEVKLQDKRLSATKMGLYKSELAQLKAEDPMPLRKAKLTSKAAFKKSKKQTKSAHKAFDAAKVLFDELKKKGGAAMGQLWWMERELEEIQKYSPKRKKKK